MGTTDTPGGNGDRRAERRQEAKGASTVGDANIGLEPRAREGSIRAMNVALANASLLTIKTKKFHWDVVGPQFMTLHKLWDVQYEALTAYVDETAERIRMLGGYPLGTAQGFLKASELQEYPGEVPNATEAVRHLLADHEAIARSLRLAIAQCTEKFDDAGSADFLTGMLQGHEKMAWMLRSFLLGSAVASTGEPTHGRIPNDA
jgi:starvation-inducible DNA-binding protein